MLGGGVSAAVRIGRRGGGSGIPILDTLQQFHIVNPLWGQANTPTSHPVLDSQQRLFRDAGESGDDFFKIRLQ